MLINLVWRQYIEDALYIYMGVCVCGLWWIRMRVLVKNYASLQLISLTFRLV